MTQLNTTTTRVNGMNMTRTVIALAAMGLCTLVAGCSRPTSSETSASSTRSQSAVDRVTATAPQRKDLKLYTTQPGRIEAFEQTPLVPKVAGYVEEVFVDIGDEVAKGDVLIKLDVPEMHDELEQQKAMVAQAEAEVKQAAAAVDAAKASVESYEARVEQAQAGIGRADGELQRWKDEHARLQELATGPNRSVTQRVVDETLNQFRAAEASKKEAEAGVTAAKAALAEAQANIQKAIADEVAAKARLGVAQANLARTQTMLGYTQIKAPFAGVITQRSVDTGHFVNPANGGSMKPLLVVARIDKVRIFVDVPEVEAPLVTAGESADLAVLRVQSLGGKEFDCKVTRTSWALDSTNRSLRTEIDIPNEDRLLRPGMYASVTILLDQRDNALALPISAIVREGNDSYCCSVESGKIARKRVELGLRSGDEVEVLSGIDSSNTIVMARSESLTPGQPVEVIDAQN